MARGTPHSDETRAAVLAALWSGKTIGEASREFGIDKAVISRWSHAKNATPAQVKAAAEAHEEEFDELLMSALKAAFRAFKAQCEVTSDPEWIRKQAADRLAILLGVTADKAFRLLEKLAAAGIDAETEPAPEADV